MSGVGTPGGVIPVGIDLGTTFSVIAHLDAQGRPWTLRNAEGDPTTPSVVFFDRSTPIVGKEAVKAAELEPDRVAICAKRDIGSSSYSRDIHGLQMPPEVIEACILSKLKRDAEMTIGPIEQVVITVPAYFNEPRRKATQDAGRLAGLEVIDIINEPTAAAIAFGVQRGLLSSQGTAQNKERFLVYDLGGGTFDVTLMEIEGQDFKAVATAGDVYLGGMDWDRRIVDFLAEQFQALHGGDDLRDDPATLTRLMKEAEDAKRALTARTEVTIIFSHEGQGIRLPLGRGQFEDMTRDLVERTRFTTRKLLKDAGCKWSDLTRLLVVGGATRMPMIQQMLEEELGRPADRSLSADEAVAHGAAIYAGFKLSGKSAAPRSKVVGSVTNVNSHDLGVLGIEPATGRPRTSVIIARNTPLPAVRKGRFATRRDNQPSVVVHVVEGGDASGNNATAIGKFTVAGLPPGLPANTPVEVVFRYAENGRLLVKASVPSVGREAGMTIERASGLTDDLLQQWQEALAQGLAVPDELEGAEPIEVVDEPAAPPGEAVPQLGEETNERSAAEPAAKQEADELAFNFSVGEPEKPARPPRSARSDKAAAKEQDRHSTSGPAADDDALGEFLKGLK